MPRREDFQVLGLVVVFLLLHSALGELYHFGSDSIALLADLMLHHFSNGKYSVPYFARLRPNVRARVRYLL